MADPTYKLHTSYRRLLYSAIKEKRHDSWESSIPYKTSIGNRWAFYWQWHNDCHCQREFDACRRTHLNSRHREYVPNQWMVGLPRSTLGVCSRPSRRLMPLTPLTPSSAVTRQVADPMPTSVLKQVVPLVASYYTNCSIARLAPAIFGLGTRSVHHTIRQKKAGLIGTIHIDQSPTRVVESICRSRTSHSSHLPTWLYSNF